MYAFAWPLIYFKLPRLCCCIQIYLIKQCEMLVLYRGCARIFTEFILFWHNRAFFWSVITVGGFGIIYNWFLAHDLGMQKRTISCFWSGKNCLGYDNKQEVQEYCSYGDFFLYFCGRWCRKEVNLEARGNKRSFTPHVDTRRQDMSEIVKSCDSHCKWTKISQEPDIDTKKYYRL